MVSSRRENTAFPALFYSLAMSSHRTRRLLIKKIAAFHCKNTFLDLLGIIHPGRFKTHSVVATNVRKLGPDQCPVCAPLAAARRPCSVSRHLPTRRPVGHSVSTLRRSPEQLTHTAGKEKDKLGQGLGHYDHEDTVEPNKFAAGACVVFPCRHHCSWQSDTEDNVGNEMNPKSCQTASNYPPTSITNRLRLCATKTTCLARSRASNLRPPSLL